MTGLIFILLAISYLGCLDRKGKKTDKKTDNWKSWEEYKHAVSAHSLLQDLIIV